jgi:hypothetical protein
VRRIATLAASAAILGLTAAPALARDTPQNDRDMQCMMVFAALSAQGVDTLRVFPLWPDFQPLTRMIGNIAPLTEGVLQNDMPLSNPAGVDEEMMKRFRETMSDDYPKKTTHHRGAFAVGGEEHSHDRSSFAAGGESTPGSNERDASHAAKSAPSAPSNDSTRGSRKNQQRQTTGQRASSKRPRRESVQTDGAKCPACDGPHSLNQCFYINKDQAPQWFKPRREMEVMVSKLLDLDVNLQAQVRALKRTRTQTPVTKFSHTPEVSPE